MKKIKILILTFVVMTLCTGCTVEYNINITSDTIDETINVVDNTNYIRTKGDILQHYNMWYPVFVDYVKDGESIELENFNNKVDGIEYYKKSIDETDYGYNYTYKYTYDIDEYYDSYALASTFIEPNVHKNNKSLVLKSSKENLLCNYEYFDEIKINITVDPKVYKLNYTNATSIENNTYTWLFDRSDCQNSQIILTLDSRNMILDDIVRDEEPEKPEGKKDYSIYIFYGILIICILVLSVILKKLKQKNNKMNEDD